MTTNDIGREEGNEVLVSVFESVETDSIGKIIHMLELILFSMNRSVLTILTFAFCVVLSCCADTNALDKAILNFPEISAWEFRPDEAVRSANVLIVAGQESACAALKRVGNAKPLDFEVDRKVCHLCRLLFESRPGKEPLRAPALGLPELLPIHSMPDPNWPHIPFAIVQDVPLSVTLGYMMATGIPESPDSYISYCASNGIFRTQLFLTPSFANASNALQALLISPGWMALKWDGSDRAAGIEKFRVDYAKEALWQQVKNMAKPSVRAMEPGRGFWLQMAADEQKDPSQRRRIVRYLLERDLEQEKTFGGLLDALKGPVNWLSAKRIKKCAPTVVGFIPPKLDQPGIACTFWVPILPEKEGSYRLGVYIAFAEDLSESDVAKAFSLGKTPSAISDVHIVALACYDTDQIERRHPGAAVVNF